MTTKMMMCSAVLGCAATMLSVGAKAQSDDMDKTFLMNASQSDINEIKLSQLAETKASDPMVKKFAEKMVTDHEKLEAQMKPFADKMGVAPAMDLDSDHKATFDTLNGLSGADFDKQYMMAMDQDHHKSLSMFKSEESSTQNTKFKASVMKGEKVVAMHTDMADKAVTKMGGTPATSM